MAIIAGLQDSSVVTRPSIEIVAGVGPVSYVGTERISVVHPSAVAGWSACGNSFLTGAQARKIIAAKFYLGKNLLPTGNFVAVLYAHGGVYGVSSVPTGPALATSDNLDITQLRAAGVHATVTFTFSGANQYLMAANTPYVIVVQSTAGCVLDVSNYVEAGVCGDVYGGNLCSYHNSAWFAVAGEDMIFSIITIANVSVQISGTKRTFLSAPATTMSLTGIKLVHGKVYKLIICCQSVFVSPAGALVKYYWRINGDVTVANYKTSVESRKIGGASFNVDFNDNQIEDNNNEGDTLFIEYDMFVTPEGNVLANRRASLYIDALMAGLEYNVGFSFYTPVLPINEVTQIDVYADVAGGLGAGSFMVLSYEE